MDKDGKNIKNNNIEHIIGRVMRFGVLLSATIMIVGLVVLVFKPTEFPVLDSIDLKFLINGIIAFDPYSIILLGIFVLILTPVVRVITSIILFAYQKDKLYVLITVAVLIILILSFIIGITR